VLFAVSHPPDPRPALAVLTTNQISDDAIEELKERMLGWGTPNGLLFGRDYCVILRDTYSSLDVDSLQEDGRVETALLLAEVPADARAFEVRVFDWLQSMAASWSRALPSDGKVSAPFIADIVPAVSGSLVREVAA
jgi:hypothetical protein